MNNESVEEVVAVQETKAEKKAKAEKRAHTHPADTDKIDTPPALADNIKNFSIS